jgi:small subunit ribosomal protein S20
MGVLLPNIKAADKWVLQSEKRTARNKGVKSRLKTLYKAGLDSGDTGALRGVESAYDNAAGKGIIHRNKAARKKARLAKAVRQTASAPAKVAKSRSSRAKK